MAEEGHEQRRRLVLVAAPFQGHINPLLQLSAVLHSKGFSITIVHTQFNSPDPSNHPGFNFLFLQDGLSDHDIASLDLTAIVLVLNDKCQLPFQECLAKLVKEQETRGDQIACVIYDELSYFSEATAHNLKLPSIIFRTSNANTFLARSVLIEMYVLGRIPLADPLSQKAVPEHPPLRQRDLPISSFGPMKNFFKLLGNARDVRRSSAIVYNTMDCLEGSSLAKLQQHCHVPIFAIGPIHKIVPAPSCSLLEEDTNCMHTMRSCGSCREKVLAYYDENGIVSCSRCGKVLEFSYLSSEASFVKTKSGESHVAGSFVRSVESENASRERLYERARDDMLNIKNGLGMGENLGIVNQAMVYYRIAVERNFTRGRRTDQVQAACLYIACRENRKPYLLIDFSIYLQINIYVLGAVFLQLCKVLNLTEHAICQKLHDPSIFIHKYTASLSGGKNKEISDDALTIIASMNYHWIQTGRTPSALWGAALYISALSHGLNCSKSDILRLVHVCGKTLSKRLVEFENTESGSLTIEELNAKVEELKESSLPRRNFGEPSSSKELLCQHKGTNRPSFGFGLCKDCYAIVIGFDGGTDPPAFQNAESQRMKKSSIRHNMSDSNLFAKELNSQCERRDDERPTREPESAGAATGHLANDSDKLHGVGDMSSKDFEESDGFSDIDDAEVDSYLHNEEEKRYKTIIWEEMNREYLQEQAAKEAAAATLKKAWEEDFKNCPEDLQAAKKLDAAVKADLAKSKKEIQQKRASEARNLAPAKSAAEAVHRMLTKKRLGSKINYDVLEKLFEDSEAKDTKKPRTESRADSADKVLHKDGKDCRLDHMNENDGLGSPDEIEDDAVEETCDDLYYENCSDDDYGNSLW
uniref:Transcription factor IIIB 90 kDa subunit-like isoform X1 n=2 Tax=Populus alba TaxID=43335 RepID=A0A4U5P646_POPAL|nr:transcription factor IIIB 90 kDa subunit-like isoform X1 [Populus alba]